MSEMVERVAEPKIRIIASIHPASGGVVLRTVPSSNRRACLIVGLDPAYAALLVAGINSADNDDGLGRMRERMRAKIAELNAARGRPLTDRERLENIARFMRELAETEDGAEE